MARNGRKALNVRSERRTLRFSFSSMSNENTDTCDTERAQALNTKLNVYYLQFSTHEDYNEIQYRPKAGEIFGKPQR